MALEMIKSSSSRQLKRRLIALLSVGAMLCGCSNAGDAMRSEKIIDWMKYEITGIHEVTFTVTTGNPKCFGLRSAVKEAGDSLEVAIIEGYLPNSPKHCAAIGRIEKLTVTTKSPAQSLNIRAMLAEEVKLIP
ncbi:hypothetical protein [Arcanobacterium haemolyticum]|nr:hypothetical protein [Arcanobacterium haemolyticum]